MRVDQKDQKRIIAPRRGLMHIVDAAGYSIAGFRRLWAEAATRLEILAAVATALAFTLSSVELWQWFVAAALFALALAVEAVNTAIEVLTDHLSPEWSVMARDAKDLGSLAVGLTLLILGGFVVTVLSGLI